MIKLETAHRCGVVLALAAALGCATGYVRGPLDLPRAEAGEVFVESIELDADRSILRGAVVLDVPPWQALNLFVFWGAG